MSVTEKEAMIAQVDAALESIRPHLAVDGGNVEVVDITDDNIVKVKWLGNCEGCSMSYVTMKAGLEETIKNMLPEVLEVLAVE